VIGSLAIAAAAATAQPTKADLAGNSFQLVPVDGKYLIKGSKK
jgi:hypothetical protein